MSLELYRQQFMTAVKAAVAEFTAYPVVVEYDNLETVDTTKTHNPHLCCEFMIVNGVQGDLSNLPFHKIHGMLVLTAKARESLGTGKCYTLLEHFYTRLQHRYVGDCRTEFATFSPPRKVQGWWGVSAVIPFRANTFSTPT